MANFPSSYIKTTSAVVTRSAEQLQFPFTAKPQAMTIYVKFIERGAITLASFSRILQIGDSAGNVPLFTIREDSNGFYQCLQRPAVGSVTSTLTAAPTIGDTVELRAVLGGDGSVQLHQSINAAAETSAAKSAALVLASAWNDQLLFVNSVGSNSVGFNAFISVKIATGEQTLTTMRQLRTSMGSGP